MKKKNPQIQMSTNSNSCGQIAELLKQVVGGLTRDNSCGQIWNLYDCC